MDTWQATGEAALGDVFVFSVADEEYDRHWIVISNEWSVGRAIGLVCVCF
jgi:hypothetical protein